MKYVYVDTAALLAIGNERDTYHQQASKIYQNLIEQDITLVTTNAVILETGNAFSPPHFRAIFTNFSRIIKVSTSWRYLIVNERMMDEAEALFQDRPDKAWSLVDCIGINVAQYFAVDAVFTADRHFQQAGFKILLEK